MYFLKLKIDYILFSAKIYNKITKEKSYLLSNYFIIKLICYLHIIRLLIFYYIFYFSQGLKNSILNFAGLVLYKSKLM